MTFDERIQEVLENQAGVGKACRPRIPTSEALPAIKTIIAESLPQKEYSEYNQKKCMGRNQLLDEIHKRLNLKGE